LKHRNLTPYSKEKKVAKVEVPVEEPNIFDLVKDE
jgi:hypothetical protein